MKTLIIDDDLVSLTILMKLLAKEKGVELIGVTANSRGLLKR
jgi:hypothetical protein